MRKVDLCLFYYVSEASEKIIKSALQVKILVQNVFFYTKMYEKIGDLVRNFLHRVEKG